MSFPFTLPNLLRQRAEATPHRIAYRFFSGNDDDVQEISYQALWAEVSLLAAHLRGLHMAGGRALLLCRRERTFVRGFLACLAAGTVAVPTAVPRRNVTQSRLAGIVRDAAVTCILYDDGPGCPWQPETGQGLPSIDLRTPLSGDAVGGLKDVAHAASADDLAFLQYTSGSTGSPKGVKVTHANLWHNSKAIQTAMDITESSSILTALPLFHDMGLVGGVVQPLVAGCTGAFLPTAHLVQYPERWFHLISEWDVTHSGGPNYLYDLGAEALAKPEAHLPWDLSSWQVAYCGAEPVRASTMRTFTEHAERVGLRPGAFFPCYGMAEATLFVSGGPAGSPARVSTYRESQVVSCGRPAIDTTVMIVDPQTRRLMPDGDSGEIWLHGPGISAGYWGDETRTEEVFGAHVTGDVPRFDGMRFMRTGDLGFFADGDLHITGRLKDLLIVNGRNYAPHDLEAEVEASHEAIQTAGSAAVAIRVDDLERIVIVAELRRLAFGREQEWPAIRSAVRARLRTAFDVAVHDVLFLRPGGLPRTSSGKVQRGQCAEVYRLETQVAVTPEAQGHGA